MMMMMRRRCVFDSGSCGMTGVRGYQLYNDGDYSKGRKNNKKNKPQLSDDNSDVEDLFLQLSV